MEGHTTKRRLYGIPLLLKDNMAMLDSMETIAGSVLLLGANSPVEACLVQWLLDSQPR